MAKSKQRSYESWAIVNGKTGDTIYSEKLDKSLTALAALHGRKIKTERLILVSTGKADPQANRITKVTLV